MELTIFVKPHLKKFLPKYLNTIEPIKIDSTNVHGKVFIAVSMTHPDVAIKFTEKEYPCPLSFSMNKDLIRIRPKKKDIQKINVYFDKLFKEIMFQWALSAIYSGGFASEGIRNFLKYYRISEDDYSWPNAHRAWMRYSRREYENTCPVVS